MPHSIIDRRLIYRPKAISYADTIEGNYLLTAADNGCWLKVDTSEGQINILIPTGLVSSYNVILENTGTNRLVFEADVSLDLICTSNYIGIRYHSAHLFHEGAGVWRAHGGLGSNTLDSLNDVVTPPGDNDRKVLAYSDLLGVYILESGVARRFNREEEGNYAIQPEDHGWRILLNPTTNSTLTLHSTGSFQVDMTVRFYNKSSYNVSVMSSQTVIADASKLTILPKQSIDVTLLDYGVWLIE